MNITFAKNPQPEYEEKSKGLYESMETVGNPKETSPHDLRKGRSEIININKNILKFFFNLKFILVCIFICFFK